MQSYKMKREKSSLFFKINDNLFIPQLLLSFICAWIFVEYMKLGNTSVVIFPTAIVIWMLLRYAQKNRAEFLKNKHWYFIFAVGISVVLVACKHMVIQFYDFYSDITANYITEYTGYDVVALAALVYTFMLLSFCAVQVPGCEKIERLVAEKPSENTPKKTGIASARGVIFLTVLLFLCWLPYLILYYPGIIYGDSTISIGQAIGKWSYSNMHPFMFTMLVKLCISIGHLFTSGNTLGCAIYSVLQMIYMGSIFAYSVCWLRNKNISQKVCAIVFLFFALPRFWGIHAVSMWKDPIFAMAVYFYSLKMFDLIYSKGEVSKDKKYILQCIITVLVMCFSRHNGKYIAVFCLLLLIVCTMAGRQKVMVRKGLIIGTAAAVLFSWGMQGPVFRHFGIVGTAAGAYGVPLQQVARTVVYDGNISDEEKEFLNEIMPLEKYRDNYSPGLVDHLKWSEDFNTEFFGSHHMEFLKVWLSLLKKNPKLYIEAWAMDTCGFWGVSYWELNSYNGNSIMGVPKKAKSLKYFGVKPGSLLDEGSSADTFLKQYFSLETPIPSVALCLWISIFMVLYALVKKKWRYLLFFIPCIGNILTLLVATPITYWPRYGLPSLCLLPVSILFPYLIMDGKSYKE